MLREGKGKFEDGNGYSFDVSVPMLRLEKADDDWWLIEAFFRKMLDQEKLDQEYEKNINREIKYLWESLGLCIQGGSIFIQDYDTGTDLCWCVALVDAVKDSIESECADSLTETLSELKKCVSLLEKHLPSQEDAS
jgi:hypothetical protein